jgi:diguanylate cyclase (GGDEF)-like protein
MFDGSYNLLLCNDRFLAIYGLSREIVQPGMPLEKLFKYTAKLEGHQKRSAPQELYDEYCDRICKNDSFSYQRRLIDERVIAVSHQKMQGIGWLDTHEDITERLNSEKQITRLALYDSLTDLPNRFQFKRELDRTLEICGSSRFAVHCLDLDGFKSINDTLGHPAGDDLLGQVARRMTACVGEQGFVSRLGGDEFAVLQPNLENREAAAKLAADIIAAINESYELDGHQAIVGGSIGVSIFPDDGLDANLLLKNADLAMYGAKAARRGTVCFFKSEMDARMKARRLLELELWKAVEEEAFEVYYQPVVDAISTEVKSFEALLRWRHPTLGMVPPSEFIPVAEETGLIVRLGEWVLRHACAEATSWPGRIGVAVNLSAIQFRDPEFVNIVFSALASSHLDPARLELEITETVLLQDSRGVLDTLHKLKSFGVRISMDDFGTGYSSLSYLRSFPFDKIKIDQCFVRGLGEASDSLAIVRAVTGLGAHLGMITLAEGVETQGELDILRNEKCNQIQGYFFSPAVPPQAIPELLNRLGKKLAEVA